MRTIHQTTKPKCDLCTQVCDVVFDGPTDRGPWANACEACAHEGLSHRQTRIEYRAKAPSREAGSAPTLVKVRIRAGDSFVKCPKCKFEAAMEEDSDATFNCEGCGKLLQCVPII